MNKKIITLLLSAMMVITFSLAIPLNGYANEKTSISGKPDASFTVVDTGQGDCILIQSQGKTMIVDAGSSGGGEPMDYLKDQNIDKVEYIVNTHMDADHINYLDDVLTEYEVDNVYYSYGTANTAAYRNYIAAINTEGCNNRHPNTGETWTVGLITVKVISDGQSGTTQNDKSVILKITCNGKSMLLMGDASSTVEDNLLVSSSDLDSDILKVGHHGSRYSSSLKFLKEVTPIYSAISCGKDNSYGHPHQETIANLNTANSIISTTATDGNIEYDINDGNISAMTDGTGTMKPIPGAPQDPEKPVTINKVNNFRVSYGNADYIKLTWDNSASVNGYVIQKYVSGTWKTIKTFNYGGAYYYSSSSYMRSGTNTFRIKAYITDDGKIYYGDYTSTKAYIPGTVNMRSAATPTYCYVSKNKSSIYHLKKTCLKNYKTLTIKTAKSRGYRACKICGTPYATITWYKNSYVSGYQIYKKVSGGSWYYYRTITNNSITSYKDTNVKSNRTYYYKIRTYKNSNNLKTYGHYGTYKGTKIQ